jgi:hypothetical protein
MSKTKLFVDVVSHLERKEISAALMGAAAMAPHGVGRVTFDFDLLTVSREVLVSAFWDGITGEIDVRKGDFDDPLAGVVRCRRRGQAQVDVVVSKDKYARDIVERAERHVVADVSMPVVQLADLILLKLDAGGTQDKWDIDRILANADVAALSAQIEERLSQLPSDARDLWMRIKP